MLIKKFASISVHVSAHKKSGQWYEIL